MKRASPAKKLSLSIPKQYFRSLGSERETDYGITRIIEKKSNDEQESEYSSIDRSQFQDQSPKSNQQSPSVTVSNKSIPILGSKFLIPHPNQLNKTTSTSEGENMQQKDYGIISIQSERPNMNTMDDYIPTKMESNNSLDNNDYELMPVLQRNEKALLNRGQVFINSPQPNSNPMQPNTQSESNYQPVPISLPQRLNQQAYDAVILPPVSHSQQQTESKVYLENSALLM